MKQLLFSTANPMKFTTAKHTCSKYGIELEQTNQEILEIQSSNPEDIALDKGSKAYELVGRPVVVTDDSWAFLGLRGFPGPYMHDINTWLNTDDLLRLVSPLKDRRVVMTQYLVYTDDKTQKVFSNQAEGTLLHEARGPDIYPSLALIAFPADNGLSVAEVYEKSADKSLRIQAKVWHDFAEWFK